MLSCHSFLLGVLDALDDDYDCGIGDESAGETQKGMVVGLEVVASIEDPAREVGQRAPVEEADGVFGDVSLRRGVDDEEGRGRVEVWPWRGGETSVGVHHPLSCSCGARHVVCGAEQYESAMGVAKGEADEERASLG
jgi:hypothetical protein